jgi:hypothetical protein
MTTTEASLPFDRAHSSLVLTVHELGEGEAVVELTWRSSSPWVPVGSMYLSSRNESLASSPHTLIVEAILKQLRLTLQGMLSEVWPPF